MKFYFCQACGVRVTEDDIDDGLARNKKLKGVYCSHCAVGVTTMESLPLTDQEAHQVIEAAGQQSAASGPSRRRRRRRSTSSGQTIPRTGAADSTGRKDKLPADRGSLSDRSDHPDRLGLDRASGFPVAAVAGGLGAALLAVFVIWAVVPARQKVAKPSPASGGKEARSEVSSAADVPVGSVGESNTPVSNVAPDDRTPTRPPRSSRKERREEPTTRPEAPREEPRPAPLPLTPEMFTVEDREGKEVRLTWQHDEASVTGFEIERRVETAAERGGQPTAGWERIATLEKQSRSHTDTSIDAGCRYAYRVRAILGEMKSAFSPVQLVDVRADSRLAAVKRFHTFHLAFLNHLRDGDAARASVLLSQAEEEAALTPVKDLLEPCRRALSWYALRKQGTDTQSQLCRALSRVVAIGSSGAGPTVKSARAAIEAARAAGAAKANLAYLERVLAVREHELQDRTRADIGTPLVHGVERSTRAKIEEARPPILIADFEGPDYGEWEISGEAFGKAPARGTLPGQQAVSGYLGKGLVNTYLNGDRSQGVAVSPAFEINRSYLNFLIGGGDRAGMTCVNLLVDGKRIRTATGANRELLVWHSWDLSDVQGKQAQIEVVDQASGGWCHILVDQIELSNAPRRHDGSPNVETKPLPLTPETFMVEDRDGKEVRLTWQYEDASSTGFEIERRVEKAAGRGGPATIGWERIATLEKQSRSHSDTSIDAGCRYAYRVRAIRGELKSPFSPIRLLDVREDPRVAAEQRFHGFHLTFLNHLRDGDVARASVLLSHAEEEAALLPVKDLLEPCRRALSWYALRKQALLKGTRVVKSRPDFVLIMADGSKREVGTKSDFQIGEVSESRFMLTGKGIEMPVKFERLSSRTQAELIDLGLGKETQDRLCRAFSLAVAIGSPDAGPTVKSGREAIEAARAAGAAKADLAYLERVLALRERELQDRTWADIGALVEKRKWKQARAALNTFVAALPGSPGEAHYKPLVTALGNRIDKAIERLEGHYFLFKEEENLTRFRKLFSVEDPGKARMEHKDGKLVFSFEDRGGYALSAPGRKLGTHWKLVYRVHLHPAAEDLAGHPESKVQLVFAKDGARQKNQLVFSLKYQSHHHRTLFCCFCPESFWNPLMRERLPEILGMKDYGLVGTQMYQGGIAKKPFSTTGNYTVRLEMRDTHFRAICNGSTVMDGVLSTKVYDQIRESDLTLYVYGAPGRTVELKEYFFGHLKPEAPGSGKTNDGSQQRSVTPKVEREP